MVCVCARACVNTKYKARGLGALASLACSADGQKLALGLKVHEVAIELINSLDEDKLPAEVAKWGCAVLAYLCDGNLFVCL